MSEQPQKRSGNGPGRASTQFKPGNCANPGGRPKTVAEVQDLARKYTPVAIEGLAKIATSGKSESARVAACSAILDRGWGKAAQNLNVAMSPDAMTEAQLMAIAAQGGEHRAENE